MFELKRIIRAETREEIAAVTGRRILTTRQPYCRTCAVQPTEMVRTFYMTFCLDSSEEIELAVPGELYEALAEGDRGKLRFQGGKFLDFQR